MIAVRKLVHFLSDPAFLFDVQKYEVNDGSFEKVFVAGF